MRKKLEYYHFGMFNIAEKLNPIIFFNKPRMKKTLQIQVITHSEMSKIRGGEWITVFIDGQRVVVWVDP